MTNRNLPDMPEEIRAYRGNLDDSGGWVDTDHEEHHEGECIYTRAPLKAPAHEVGECHETNPWRECVHVVSMCSSVQDDAQKLIEYAKDMKSKGEAFDLTQPPPPVLRGAVEALETVRVTLNTGGQLRSNKTEVFSMVVEALAQLKPYVKEGE